MKLRHSLIAASALLAFGAQAASINLGSSVGFTQSDFRTLSEDLGAAVSYKPMIPAESMGLLGFDIGASVGGTKLQSAAALSKASGGAAEVSTLPFAMVRAHKGLPFNIDVGVALGSLPGTNVSTRGGELRWAFMPGSLVTPAIAARLAISSMSGVSDLDVSTTSLDVSISKGFLMFKPYVGAGIVQVKSTPGASTGLQAENFTQQKVFAGLNVNLGLMNLAFETDKTGNNTSYGAKFGFRF